MSSNGLRKIRAAIERDEATEEVDTATRGKFVCPKCNRKYPPDTQIVVCKDDRTLLMKVREYDHVVANKVSGSFAERYQVRQLAGEGDLTRVYYAQDMQTWSEVVLKTVKPHLLGTARRIRRFADSLQETISLQHPGIVRVLDAGISGETETSVPQVYFVVEKLKVSKNLKTILHQTGPMAPYVVIETMVKACEILDYAAKNGWMHRDIKPSNIFISLDGEQVSVKISDFGVAERMFHNLEWESNATKTTSIYGNAAYIAPEVAFGAGGGIGGVGGAGAVSGGLRGVGAAGAVTGGLGGVGEHTLTSDIYSLGCTMYHVLKGMQPFEGNNDFDTIMQHVDKPPRAFADELRIPKELEAIVMKCLEKNPKQRYQDFGELGSALNGVRYNPSHNDCP